MPMLYFEVIDHEITTGEDGLDRPSSVAAIEKAHLGARSLAATAALDGHLNLKLLERRVRRRRPTERKSAFHPLPP
jgi:hypothetical protein